MGGLEATALWLGRDAPEPARFDLFAHEGGICTDELRSLVVGDLEYVAGADASEAPTTSPATPRSAAPELSP